MLETFVIQPNLFLFHILLYYLTIQLYVVSSVFLCIL
jgi:hypothetical protein